MRDKGYHTPPIPKRLPPSPTAPSQPHHPPSIHIHTSILRRSTPIPRRTRIRFPRPGRRRRSTASGIYAASVAGRLYILCVADIMSDSRCPRGRLYILCVADCIYYAWQTVHTMLGRLYTLCVAAGTRAHRSPRSPHCAHSSHVNTTSELRVHT